MKVWWLTGWQNTPKVGKRDLSELHTDSIKITVFHGRISVSRPFMYNKIFFLITLKVFSPYLYSSFGTFGSKLVIHLHQNEYRIPFNNIRGYYWNFPFFSAEIIRGWTLLEELNIYFFNFLPLPFFSFWSPHIRVDKWMDNIQQIADAMQKGL